MANAEQNRIIENNQVKQWREYLYQPISQEAYDELMKQITCGEIPYWDRVSHINKFFFGTEHTSEYRAFSDSLSGEERTIYDERLNQANYLYKQSFEYALIYDLIREPFYPTENTSYSDISATINYLNNLAYKIYLDQTSYISDGVSHVSGFNRDLYIDKLLYGSTSTTPKERETILSYLTPEETEIFNNRRREIEQFIDAARWRKYPHRPLVINHLTKDQCHVLSERCFNEKAWNKFVYGYDTGNGVSSAEQKEKMFNNLSAADKKKFEKRLYDACTILHQKKKINPNAFKWCEKGLSTTEKKILEMSEVFLLAQQPTTINRPLFEGQTGHALTGQEKQQFEDKINTWLLSEKHETPVKTAFQEMMKYPTGREQIRQIITHPDAQFYIRSNFLVDFFAEINEYSAYNGGLVTSVSTDSLEASSSFLGPLLLHEILHDRSHSERPSGNYLLADSETQALDEQLYAEINYYWRDPAYGASYQINLTKWVQIVSDNGAGKPDWAFEFKPIPGLSPEELKIAKACYIQQMAAMETRTQFMEDFYAPREALNYASSLPVRSYKLLNTSLRHYDSTDTRWKEHLVSKIPDETISYFKEHYPSLDLQRMQSHAATLYDEHQDYFFKPNKKYHSHTDIKKDLPETEDANKFYEILHNKNIPIAERYNQAFTNVLNVDMSESTKLYLMLNILDKSRTENFEVYFNLLERFRQETGFDNFEKKNPQANNSHQPTENDGLYKTLANTGICITNRAYEDINTAMQPPEKTTSMS